MTKKTKTTTSSEEKRPVGRPPKYANDAERKAARAKAARERRASERAAGLKEVRRLVKPKDAPLESGIIALDHIPLHRRR